MKNIAALRINMTEDPAATPEEVSARYQAAIGMAEYVDKHNFQVVSLEEHHCAENGWLPIEQSWHYLRNFIEKVWAPHTRNN